MSTPFRLVVGFDSSELGHQALWQAIALANAAKTAEIYVVRASDPPASQAAFAIGAPAMDAMLVSAIDDLQRELAPFMTKPEVQVIPKVQFGRPSDVICDLAREVAADYVLVGTHGRKGLARAVMGPVAELIVRNAPCTVIVVRAREADAEPKVEPLCPTCAEVRQTTGGKHLFCNNHLHKGRELHLHYAYAQPFARGAQFIRDE
jgi:nucleotide-binding universal stress UspA family protein